MKEHRPRLNWSSLATKADVDPKSLRRWRDGGLATSQKVEELAKALKTEPQVIALGWMPCEAIMNEIATPKDEGSSVATVATTRNSAIKIDAHSLSQEELTTILKAVTIILNRKQSITLDGTREGCVEILVKLTDDEIRTLQEAISAGTMKHLRVIGVKAIDPIEGASVPTPPTPSLSFGRLRLSAQILAAASVCLSFTGVIPVYACPWYVGGLILAAASLYFSFAAGSRLVLPLIALLMNLIAIICWPNVVGFFAGPNGYSFTVGSRASEPTLDAPKGLKAYFLPAPLIPPLDWKDGEYIEIFIDGKKIIRCLHSNGGMTSQVLDPAWIAMNKMTTPVIGAISFGTHVIAVEVNGKTVFSKRVTIEPCDPESAIVSISVSRNEARVYEEGKRGHIEY